MSRDCIAGSGRQLIEVTYFLKLSADSSWFSGPFLKGGIQYASVYGESWITWERNFIKDPLEIFAFDLG